jgi:hypothetical protein
MYTKSDFGKALLFELDKGYDVVRLSNWAIENGRQQAARFIVLRNRSMP